MTEVILKNIVKNYGKLEVVHGINLEIMDGEFVVLVGPSGCGKSTSLRMIAGLEDVTGGEILIGGRVVNELPPRERNISMVFQNYALYPHMTVAENLSFSLMIAKYPQSEIDTRIADTADILGLDDLMDRRPAELSGGQRQRVAMGRAIVRHPDVYLFDEPLSNLDAKLRSKMRVEIKKLHQKVKSTIIYVTHDQVEAMTLADRIVLMHDGNIIQIGTPLELFNNPINVFAATFIGSPPMNILDGVIQGDNILISSDTVIPIPKKFNGKISEGQKVNLGFRADNLMPIGHSVDETGDMFDIDLNINLSEPLGTESLLFAEIGGVEIQAKMLNPRPVKSNETLRCQLMLDKIHLFDAKSTMAI